MPFAFGGKIDGLEEAMKNLQTLEKKIAKKALKKGVTEASKLILRKAKAGVQKASGLLKKSLGRKVKVFRESGAVVAIVGPRVGYKQEVHRRGSSKPVLANPTRYSHLVELGTSRSKPYPFLAPAFESTKAEAQRKIEDAINDAIGR